MTALLPENFEPVRSEGDLTYEDHGELIRSILFARGTAMPLGMLVKVLVDMGVIILKPWSTVYLYPSHPYRLRLKEIVERLYKEGRLEGLGGPKPVEVAHARVWSE